MVYYEASRRSSYVQGAFYNRKEGNDMKELRFRDYYEKLLGQLALELNCTPDDFRSKENVITLPEFKEGRRSYHPGVPFLQMATAGGNTVISADGQIHEFLRGLTKDAEGHRLFELGNLMRIDAELRKYGWVLCPTHHMFLPCRETETDGRFEVKWFFDGDIAPFYGDCRFPNAICFPKPNPGTPDRMIVCAMDGDRIMGMSGCSEDAPGWFQIGIDVLPEYRSQGLGTYLVTLVKNEVIRRGGIPFYGTAAANVFSQSIAFGSGFRPAWVETEAKPTGID